MQLALYCKHWPCKTGTVCTIIFIIVFKSLRPEHFCVLCFYTFIAINDYYNYCSLNLFCYSKRQAGRFPEPDKHLYGIIKHHKSYLVCAWPTICQTAQSPQEKWAKYSEANLKWVKVILVSLLLFMHQHGFYLLKNALAMFPNLQLALDKALSSFPSAQTWDGVQTTKHERRQLTDLTIYFAEVFAEAILIIFRQNKHINIIKMFFKLTFKLF